LIAIPQKPIYIQAMNAVQEMKAASTELSRPEKASGCFNLSNLNRSPSQLKIH